MPLSDAEELEMLELEKQQSQAQSAAPAAPPQKLVPGTNAGIPDANPSRPDLTPPLDTNMTTPADRAMSSLYEKLPYGIRDAIGHIAPALLGHQPELGAMAEGAGPAVQSVTDRIPSVPKLPSITQPDWLKTARGQSAKTAAEDLRGQANIIADAEAGKANTTAGKIAEQLKQQPAKAAQRAEMRTVDPAKAAAEKIAVQQKAIERSKAAQAAYEKAGMSTKEAQAEAARAEQAYTEAQQSADAMEKELLARPTATKEETGEIFQNTVQKYADTREAARRQQVGFDKVIANAGDKPVVNTAGIKAEIDKHLAGIKNPPLEQTLNQIKELVGDNDLTLAQADSLRKYLDSVLQAREGSPLAVAGEARGIVGKVKDTLMDGLTASGEPNREAYAKALADWRRLSRPLDIVERKGALKGVIAKDPMSESYLMDQAKVVDHIISKARTGSPVFTKMLEENPELREPARRYFTQDLFGGEHMPTESGLRTWLKTNEIPLKQLGLYDDFRDIKTARATAQAALDAAKGVVSEAKQGVKTAADSERIAAEKTSSEGKLAKMAQSRAESAQKAAGTPEKPTKAPSSVQQKITNLRTTRDRLRSFQTEVQNAKPEEVAGKIRTLGKSLVNDGVIDQKQYDALLKAAGDVDKSYADKAKVQKILKTVAGVVGTGLAGDIVLKHLP